MSRILFAALALACVCSPAMAFGALPAPTGTGSFLAALGGGICLGVALASALPMRARLPISAFGFFIALTGASLAAEEVAKIGDASVTLSAEAMVAAAAPTVSAFAVTALSGLATILLGRIGPVWLSSLLASRIEIVVRTAVDYALNAVEGAAKGQVLTIPVGSAVVAKALQRALDSTPAWVIRMAGGPAEIGARIFRSLHLEPDSTAAKVLEPALQGLGTGAR